MGRRTCPAPLCTSVGLTFRQQPILGHSSLLGETFWGAHERSATTIQTSTCSALADSLLVTGFAYDRHTRLDNNYAEFCWFTHRTHGVRRGGAAAVDLALWRRPSGRLPGAWTFPGIFAGVALVDLAGGSVTGYGGEPFDITVVGWWLPTLLCIARCWRNWRRSNH